MNRKQPITTGQRLRHWREIKGLSIRELARSSGIHKSSLHRIECDAQEAREADVQKLIKALDLSVSTFYGEVAA